MIRGFGAFREAWAIWARQKTRSRRFCRSHLHGRLDTGEAITLLNARNHGGPGQLFFGLPRYVVETAVLGEHIEVDQPINALRFRLGQRYWLDHLDNGGATTTPDGAALSVQASEDGNWLLYTPAVPASLRHLDRKSVV